MIVIGLTGSIGMGKTTTARLFAEEGAAVHDADAAVHRLYCGDAAPMIAEAFPGTVVDGVVDRKELGKRVLENPSALARLEAIVHPLVRASEADFLREAKARGDDLAVLDIPLLFETGREGQVDMTVVVSAGEAEQRRRVLERPGMTEALFAKLLARQTPDAEKRARADVVIDSSQGVEHARGQVRALLARLKAA